MRFLCHMLLLCYYALVFQDFFTVCIYGLHCIIGLCMYVRTYIFIFPLLVHSSQDVTLN